MLERNYTYIHTYNYCIRTCTYQILKNLHKKFLTFIINVSSYISGFQLILTLTAHNTFVAMKHLLFIVVLLVQLFIYCFAGQTLECQSQGLAYAIYETSWYNFNVSVIKDFPLMILRAANPHRLTAEKFLAMNFDSFKKILKASASYLSVLRVMMDM